jgi:hypothetical protein
MHSIKNILERNKIDTQSSRVSDPYSFFTDPDPDPDPEDPD